MAMTNLKMSTSEQGESILTAESPAYPYGLTITLDHDVLNRLGIDNLPNVGTMMVFNAQAEVIGVSKDEIDGETRREVRLQITDMEISNNRDREVAQALFGGDG